MRKSVETISEKLGNFTSEKLKKEVNYNIDSMVNDLKRI